MKKIKNTTNLAASVKAKLYNIAKQHKVELNVVLRQFIQERFLYRLSVSKYSNYFILKGAVLFTAYGIGSLRPTKDIDFLGVNISTDTVALVSVISEIAAIEFDDGLNFQTEQLTNETIREGEYYEGIRFHIPAKLGSVKQNLLIDIGFGDKIVIRSQKVTFPTILDFAAPVLTIYSIESAIAEKFEAIVSLGSASSRMKDYYDIIQFISIQSFRKDELKNAIIATFANRRTPLENMQYIFTQEYFVQSAMQTNWENFLTRRKLEGEVKFSIVMAKLEKFFVPIFEIESSRSIWNHISFTWE